MTDCKRSLAPMFALLLSVAAVDAADPTAPPNTPGLPHPGLPTPPEKTEAFVPDSTLARKVESVLNEHRYNGIKVSSDMGVVALVGAVDSEDTRQRIARLVSGVQGVKGVETSQIEVRER